MSRPNLPTNFTARLQRWLCCLAADFLSRPAYDVLAAVLAVVIGVVFVMSVFR
jgi:hypothetical protein